MDAVGAILASAVFMMRDFTIIDLAAAPFLPSQYAAQEAENARVVRVEPDDGPRARRRHPARQEDQPQARHPLSRRLQPRR